MADSCCTKPLTGFITLGLLAWGANIVSTVFLQQMVQNDGITGQDNFYIWGATWLTSLFLIFTWSYYAFGYPLTIPPPKPSNKTKDALVDEDALAFTAHVEYPLKVVAFVLVLEAFVVVSYANRTASYLVVPLAVFVTVLLLIDVGISFYKGSNYLNMYLFHRA